MVEQHGINYFNMKKILPFTFWLSGITPTAVYLYLNCAGDNLIDSATFYWALYSEIDGKPGNKLTEGNLTMTGADYDAWDTNEYACNWAAAQLGVTFDTTAPAEDAPALKKGKKS